MPRYAIEITTPRFLSTTDFQILIPVLKEMDREVGTELKTWDRALNGWSAENMPDWDIDDADQKGDDLEAKYFATREKSPIFVYVMGGTEINYARMSREYRPRTRRGKLTTRAAQGSFLKVGAPHKGIEGREWHFLIAERRQKPYTKNMQKAVNKAAVKAFKAAGFSKVRIVL